MKYKRSLHLKNKIMHSWYWSVYEYAKLSACWVLYIRILPLSYYITCIMKFSRIIQMAVLIRIRQYLLKEMLNNHTQVMVNTHRDPSLADLAKLTDRFKHICIYIYICMYTYLYVYTYMYV
jgi:hypothetical protein